jgi:hypothetical protein
MTSDQYVEQVLARYTISTGPSSPALRAANKIAPTLRAWAGTQLVDISVSGSYAKGTGVAGTTDIDLFISLKSTAADLKTIYEGLAKKAHESGWAPRLQNVSIGCTVDGVKIDLVPGRVQEGYQNYHSLWKRKAATWTQTNVQLHIDKVVKSGRQKEIRATKIWRVNHNLNFPSFYLELSVLNALSGHGTNLGNNFLRVLEYLGSDIEFTNAVIIDPANTNNRISDDLNGVEKGAIAIKAKQTRPIAWDQTLW